MSSETMTDALRERIAKAGPDDPVGTLADMERYALHVADAREARLRGEAQAVARVQKAQGPHGQLYAMLLPEGPLGLRVKEGDALYTRPQPVAVAADMPPPGKPFVGCQCPSCGEEFVASAAPAPLTGEAVATLPAKWRSATGGVGDYDRGRMAANQHNADALEAALAQDRASQAAAPSAPVGVGAGWYRYNKPAPRWEDTKFGKWLDPAVYGPPREQHGYSLEVAALAQQQGGRDDG